jgi:hypothetical protein
MSRGTRKFQHSTYECEWISNNNNNNVESKSGKNVIHFMSLKNYNKKVQKQKQHENCMMESLLLTPLDSFATLFFIKNENNNT